MFILQQAVTVFASRHAIVMGPTPPGTGVIASAIDSQSWKSTSPTILYLSGPFSGAGTLLIPTSMIQVSLNQRIPRHTSHN